MEEIRDFSGNLLGYSFPELERLQNTIGLATLNNKALGFALPPELQKINGLVKLQSLKENNLGFILPPDIEKMQKVVKQLTQHLPKQDISHLTQKILNIKQLIEKIEPQNETTTQTISQQLDNAACQLNKNKRLSFKIIFQIIMLLYGILTIYPNLKEFYQDIFSDPILEICGVISEMEKEAIKFAEIDHKGGAPLYRYPNGKKSDDYLLNGTQVCLLSQPKGNARRVKVIFQLENHTQITGYVERNKLKRLYQVN